MIRIPGIAATFLMAGLAMSPQAVSAKPLYNVVDLGTAGGGASSAMAINNRGDIVGWSRISSSSTNNVRAVMFDRSDSSNVTVLPSLGGATNAFGINEQGLVVGTSQRPNQGRTEAVVFDIAKPSEIRVLGGDLTGLSRQAVAINNAGQIAGVEGGRAILLSADSQAMRVDLGTLGGVPRNGSARAINDSGQIVGSSERSDGNRYLTLFDPSGDHSRNRQIGAFRGGAEDINERGQIAATLVVDGKAQAALLDLDSPERVMMLGTDGFDRSFSSAINNAGQVIGMSFNEDTSKEPWIYDPTVGLTQSLTDLIDPTDPFFGVFALENVFDINDSGEIVGLAFFPDAGDEGEFHAVLLTPVSVVVSEPSSMALFVLGLIGFVVTARRG